MVAQTDCIISRCSTVRAEENAVQYDLIRSAEITSQMVGHRFPNLRRVGLFRFV